MIKIFTNQAFQVDSNNHLKPILFISFAFIISLFLRWEYLGTLSEGHHQWGTAQFKLVIENWIEDGINVDNYLRLIIPKSIDFNVNENRGLYISYPIGVDFLIYSLKLLFEKTETLKLIHLINATHQYIISILIFYIVDKIDLKTNTNTKNFFSLTAAISYIFFPAPFYYQFLSFGYDQAMVLPFVAILFLELLIRNKLDFKFFLIQSLLFLWAGSIDYFSIILGLTILFFRIILPIKNINLFKNIIQIFLPLSIPYIFYFYQLIENNLYEKLFDRFKYRTGIDFLTGSKNKTNYYNSFVFHFWIKKLHIYLPIILISIFF